MITSTQTVPRGLDYHGEPEQQLQRLFLDCGVQPEKVGSPEGFADAPPVFSLTPGSRAQEQSTRLRPRYQASRLVLCQNQFRPIPH